MKTAMDIIIWIEKRYIPFLAGLVIGVWLSHIYIRLVNGFWYWQ